MLLLFEYLEKLCRPHSHVIQEPHQQEIILKRNKGILFIELTSLIFTILYILFTNRTPSPMQKGFLLVLVAIIVVFLMFCRSYPQIFTLLYFLLVAGFGPIFYYYYKESVFFNSVAVVLLPTWVLCLTGNKSFFFTQVILQNAYLHFLYKPQMLTVFESMSPESYFQRVSNITTFGAIINAIFVLTSEFALEKAHYRIIEAENRKFQLDRQKTFFLSFSHEIRNLINSMIGNIRLCMLESVPKKIEKLMQNSEVCGEVLLHLVNNILDTGKVQIGELEIHATQSIMSEVWEKTWGICSQLIKQKRLLGQFRIQKSIPKILVIDTFRLMQIFLNLVGNAIKFTQNGSILIEVQWIESQEQLNESCFEPVPFTYDDQEEGLFERDQDFGLFDKKLVVLGLDSKNVPKEGLKTNSPHQLIGSAAERGILKIIVSDTGCGIPKDKLPRLFHQFAQVHEDPSMRKIGTGLGLFITKELISKMGGEIRAFSQPGKGTVFIICIPTGYTTEQ